MQQPLPSWRSRASAHRPPTPRRSYHPSNPRRRMRRRQRPTAPRRPPSRRRPQPWRQAMYRWVAAAAAFLTGSGRGSRRPRRPMPIGDGVTPHPTLRRCARGRAAPPQPPPPCHGTSPANVPQPPPLPPPLPADAAAAKVAAAGRLPHLHIHVNGVSCGHAHMGGANAAGGDGACRGILYPNVVVLAIDHCDHRPTAKAARSTSRAASNVGVSRAQHR